MNEEMILSLARLTQMNKEALIEKINEYKNISLKSIYDFYSAFCRFPTPEETELIKEWGIDPLLKAISSQRSQSFKVIHVELKKPYLGENHYYFGSKTAIYEQLPEEIVGIKKESLWNVDLNKGEYSNKHCIIRMGVLCRKQTARGGDRKKGGI